MYIFVKSSEVNDNGLPYPSRRLPPDAIANGAADVDGDDCAEDSSDPGMGGGLWGGSSGDFEVNLRCCAPRSCEDEDCFGDEMLMLMMMLMLMVRTTCLILGSQRHLFEQHQQLEV